MKKAISVLLTIAMLLSIFSMVSASAVIIIEVDDYDFTVNYDGTATVTGYTGTDTALNIPSELNGHTVTVIGGNAFGNYEKITSVVIPDTVTDIEYEAFSNCKSLTSVTIGKSVRSISNSAFNGCVGLTTVNLPDSLKLIGYYAFSGCTSLAHIDLSDSLNSISGYAFSGCTALTSIDISSSVTSIGEYAFNGCTSLSSVQMTDSITQIGDYAFYKCTSLNNITVPGSVTSIGTKALGYFQYYDETIWENVDKTIDGFTIYGYNNTRADKYANANGINFIVLVPLVDYVTGISIDIPDDNGITVKELKGQEAAAAADALPKGSQVQAVYNIQVTENSIAVQPVNNVKVMIPSDNPDASVFRQEADGTLTNMKAVYKDRYLVFYTDHFSVYIVAEVPESLPDDAPDEVTWSVDGTVLTISGKGPMEDYENESPWKSMEITDVIIENGVTSIGDNAFNDCSDLIEASIPDSVTSIGKNAFYNCVSLESPDLPDSVTSIGDYAFFGCAGIASVSLPSSLTSIGEHTFYGCIGLTSVTIPGSVTDISASAFGSCGNLKSVIIGKGVKSIGRYAFSSCGSLTAVTIPDSVITIGDAAFSDCNENLIIIGKKGSAAETYCSREGITFRPITSALIGDTDRDGKITISDVTEIQKYLAEFVQFTGEQLTLADTNGDGKIDIGDATHLQKYLAEFDGIVLGKQN